MIRDLPHVQGIPVRTPTLPPATHTNVWVLGHGALTVVDPASPWDDQRALLFSALRERITRGERVERLFLTHHHADHVSGASDLQRRLAQIGLDVSIVAHPATAELLEGTLEVQQTIEHREVLDCGGVPFVAHHTPGHAPGHLVLHDPTGGAIVAGDMVAGVGTILIDPREGDLQHYLDSLEAIRRLGGRALLPAHGPVLEHPDEVLSFYIAHRNGRSAQIREALTELGSATPLELAPVVYPELDAGSQMAGAIQIHAHLLWLESHALASREGERWRAA